MDKEEKVVCNFCHELRDKEDCIFYCGRWVCLCCAGKLGEILEDMRRRI